MNEIVKVFKHLARDILIYILPGLTLLSYASFVCIDLFELSSWDKLLTSRNFILLIIAAYIIGHIILAFMELFAMLKIDSFLKKKIFQKDYSDLIELTKDKNEAELEVLAFSNKDAYDFFVERHTQLLLFRWNLSGSFLIISISSFILIFFCSNCILFWIGIISILIFIILFIFSIRTELDGQSRRIYLANKN